MIGVWQTDHLSRGNACCEGIGHVGASFEFECCGSGLMSGICGNGLIMRYCEDSEAGGRYLRVFLLFVEDGECGVWGRLLRWWRCRAASWRENILLHLQLIPEILFQLSETGEQCLDRLFRAARV